MYLFIIRRSHSFFVHSKPYLILDFNFNNTYLSINQLYCMSYMCFYINYCQMALHDHFLHVSQSKQHFTL